MVTKGAAVIINFKMVDDTNYLPLPGLTMVSPGLPDVCLVDTEISYNGNDFVATTNDPVEIGDGWYYVELTAAETNYDEIILKCTASGAAQSDGVIAPQTAATSSTTNVTTQGGGSAAALLYANNCAWNNKDIAIIRDFFKKYSSHVDKLTGDRDTATMLNLKLSEFVLESNTKFTEIDSKVSELLHSIEKIELLLVKNATLDDLEVLHGSY